MEADDRGGRLPVVAAAFHRSPLLLGGLALALSIVLNIPVW